MKKNRFIQMRGFSLIELMVVISIIGILMALGAVSYTTAQKKARDATRKGDMRAVSNAFEQYYTASGGEYGNPCSTMATSEFIPGGLPADPQPSQNYSFNCTVDSYCVCAQLESDAGNSTNAGCVFGSGDYYCLTNQQ